MREITVSFWADAPGARYALGVLFELLDLRMRERETGDHVEVAYGDGCGRISIPATPAGSWNNGQPMVSRRRGLPVLHAQGCAPTDDVPGFDLLYATYASLTAPWELTDPADEVGCPIARGGFLGRHGLLLEPLVHRYAALLGDLVGATPRGEPRLVLTHDVDDNFSHLFARRVSAELLRRDLAARRLTAVRRAAGLVRRLRPARRPDPNDRFDDWQAWHTGWASRPAYFVASKGLLSPASARQDVPYDVRHPAVRKTLRTAVAAGAEIGVHFSINARESAQRLRDEREALEEAAGTSVHSARHHWWALSRPPEPTWRAHAEAGIALDCSLGFNDAPGFRRGICVPFRPFDPDRGQPLRLYVLPTVAMDAALPLSRPEELRAVFELLERTVREVCGALVLDWHVHAANTQAFPGAASGLRAFVAAACARGLELRTPLELLAERRLA